MSQAKRRAEKEWVKKRERGRGRGINQEEQNNNVHVAKLSGEIDIAHRRHLS